MNTLKDTSPIPAKPRYEPVPQWRRDAPKGTIGAVHEMLVSYDLLKRGWHVFRSISSSPPYKLIAIKGEKEIKVEVTTGHRFGELLHHPKRKPGLWDILAIVVKDDEIIYQPEMDND